MGEGATAGGLWASHPFSVACRRLGLAGCDAPASTPPPGGLSSAKFSASVQLARPARNSRSRERESAAWDASSVSLSCSSTSLVNASRSGAAAVPAPCACNNEWTKACGTGGLRLGLNSEGGGKSGGAAAPDLLCGRGGRGGGGGEVPDFKALKTVVCRLPAPPHGARCNRDGLFSWPRPRGGITHPAADVQDVCGAVLERRALREKMDGGETHVRPPVVRRVVTLSV